MHTIIISSTHTRPLKYPNKLLNTAIPRLRHSPPTSYRSSATHTTTHATASNINTPTTTTPHNHHHNQDLSSPLLTQDLSTLTSQAAALRDAGHPTNIITFSPKVFIPITRICRDSCGYCTFALPPTPGRRCYMTIQEILDVAILGAQQGCTEALFTLGDKPELLYPEAALELIELGGYKSTIEYVADAAKIVLKETGLLPHINAGVMSDDDIALLKECSVSQGLMVESTSLKLLSAPGQPHYNCPDKVPEVRLATLTAAGKAAVPYTTGLLIGIGESRQDRLDTLLAIKDIHDEYGHIQELIIQPFRAKKNTLMELAPEPPLEELLWTVAVARILFGPYMSIQAPPNLLTTDDDDDSSTSTSSEREDDGNIDNNTTTGNKFSQVVSKLIGAGINDWGGVSPVTRDYVNPEKTWPHVMTLSAATAECGKMLLPRLPVYPQYITQSLIDTTSSSGGSERKRKEWLSGKGGRESVLAATLRLVDGQGLGRRGGGGWFAGLASPSVDIDDDGGGGGGGGSTGMTNNTTTIENNNNSSSSSKRSVPAPRVRAALAYNIAVDDVSGVLLGSTTSSNSSGITSSILPPPSPLITGILNKINNIDNTPPSPVLSEAEVTLLFTARGRDFSAICQAADELRQRVNGNVVTYVVNRNINYTNVCTYSCRFCAFSKGKSTPNDNNNNNNSSRHPVLSKESPYLLSMEEISRRTAEAWDRGATEVCMQGGIHPDFTGHTYLNILKAAKLGAPDIHIHAFSPLEVTQGARTLGWSLEKYLTALKEAGLGSLPGTAAEILDDAVRAELCPDKLTTNEWVDVVATAHSVGLNTTSTIMFGHCDTYDSWARHLLVLKDLASIATARARKEQEGGGGGGGIITEFVPLPFVHMEAPIYLLSGRSRKGPTLRECILMHAIARLVLHPHITNIQASWVKMGPSQAARLLTAGCNDMGGTLMNESITRAAGAGFGQEVGPGEMERLIREVGYSSDREGGGGEGERGERGERGGGRIPQQRTTIYCSTTSTTAFSDEQRKKSYEAHPLVM